MVGYFIGHQQSNFYQSNRFMNVMKFAQQNGNLCKVKEKETDVKVLDIAELIANAQDL